MTSKFENDNEIVHLDQRLLRQRHRHAPTSRADNKYTRFAGNATFRQLPLNSTLAARFTRTS